MGTRADFWIGTDPEKMEWLGSIAWDGYPDGIPDEILKAPHEQAYRGEVAAFIAKRDDGCTPEEGYPFPWGDNCGLTDCPYTWHAGHGVLMQRGYPSRWVDINAPRTDTDEYGDPIEPAVIEPALFPDLTAQSNVPLGGKSGFIVIGG